jgi:hypothetical protein
MGKTKRRLAVAVLFGILGMAVSWSASKPTRAAEEPAQKNEGKQSDLAKQLIGTWKLEEASTPGSPSGIGTRLKFFTGTHWCIIQPDPNTGVIVFQHGGRYELEGNVFKETRDFAGASTKSMIGGKTTLKLEIDGDTMKQADADGVFNETWKRVK